MGGGGGGTSHTHMCTSLAVRLYTELSGLPSGSAPSPHLSCHCMYVCIIDRAGTINRLIDNQSILKHQTDYQKQNLISINRKNL